MATRDELLAATSERYRTSSRGDKSTIIDECKRRCKSRPVERRRCAAAYMLARIADTPQSRLPELLPWNWKAESAKLAA